MRKNYFAKLIKYMKDVYHVERGLNKLSDARVNPTYSTGQVILPVLFGFLLRIKSFNELVYSIVETAKANKLNVYMYMYLVHILSKMPGLDLKTDPALLDDFMPWSEKIPDYCRNTEQ